MDLSKIYSVRPPNVHKGNFGSVLVIAGSKLYSGSATLASCAALRAGCDLVTVVAPQRAADVASHLMPDLITYPLKGDYFSGKHINDVMDILLVRKVNSVVLGCGMGRHASTLATIRKVIGKFSVPMVLDADALIAVSGQPSVLSGKHFVLTPHAGEAAVLLEKEKINDDFESRAAAAKQIAAKYKGVVLLKGYVDVISDGTSMMTNNTGTPYMTKGGFGDVLSGILGALLARGVGLFEAAHVAAYINGKAGELASDYFGEGVAASDIFAFIPKVIHSP